MKIAGFQKYGFDTPEQSGACTGSVTLYQGSEETVVTEDINIRIKVDRVKVEGCGCFSLYFRKGGQGRS